MSREAAGIAIQKALNFGSEKAVQVAAKANEVAQVAATKATSIINSVLTNPAVVNFLASETKMEIATDASTNVAESLSN